MKTYAEFRAAIRARESGDNYGCVNEFGYLGAYQFGMARLCDLGLASRVPGTHSMANSSFQFTHPLTEQAFLENTRLQDLCFDRHVMDLKRKLASSYNGRNLSGAIAACHLVGYQAFLEYWRYGKDCCDANGTKVSEYYSEFSGYQTP